MDTVMIWLGVGLAGQACFTGRFLIQWLVSEKKRQSVIPLAFWYCSLLGGVLLFSYALHQRDPVFLLGQSTGVVIYTRNLVLVRRRQKGRCQCSETA